MIIAVVIGITVLNFIALVWLAVRVNRRELARNALGGSTGVRVATQSHDRAAPAKETGGVIPKGGVIALTDERESAKAEELRNG
jgi:hypothetical protein